MHSIWSETVQMPCFEMLQEDKTTDVLIIGGGMAGILCAYMLEQAGVDYMLVEADRICQGMTKNTTAKITSQHGLIYHQLLDTYGAEKARMYLDANQDALETYRRLCRQMDCDFAEKDAVVYAMDNRKKCEAEAEALEKLGFQAEFEENLPLPFDIAGAVRFAGQAQFHPLKFVSAVVQGLNIYEHTCVRGLAPHTAVTDHAKITADKIIVATHFPFLNKHGSYFLKMYQHRSYVMALADGPDVGGMYVDEAQKGMSFRNYKEWLLIGGGDHRTGKLGGNWEELEKFAAAHYPKAKAVCRWAAQDCMTLDGIPYIGQYSGRTPNLYVATGFNKWGMTTAMAAAKLLADMVVDRKNPHESVFSPSRSIWHPQLAVNISEAMANLLTPAKRRCPHMGCALKWNPQEHSWDCPCHGSRFEENGTLIDNPATGNLKKQKGDQTD